MRRDTDIQQLLRPLDSTPYQVYLSAAVQVADVLEWILQQTGRAEVWQTSFSISEEFLRRLYFIEQTGLIQRYTLILDHKATNKTLSLWAFIRQVAGQTFLADNHSKLLLVRSLDAAHSVCMLTSQNLTRGNRAESAFLSTDANLFASLLAQVDDLIRHHAVPLGELFQQRLADTPLPDGANLSESFGKLPKSLENLSERF